VAQPSPLQLTGLFYQAKLPVDGGEYQHIHKTFDPRFALSTGCAKIKMGQSLREWPTNDWPNLRHTP